MHGAVARTATPEGDLPAPRVHGELPAPAVARPHGAPSPLRKAANRLALDTLNGLRPRGLQLLRPQAPRGLPAGWGPRRVGLLCLLAGLALLLYARAPLPFSAAPAIKNNAQAPANNPINTGDGAQAPPDAPPDPAPAIGSRPPYRIPFSDADVEADAAVARNVEAGRAVLKQRLRRRDAPSVPDGRRYMLYMYHSGLNNQRVAFANALLIAHTLNLTLVVPPAMLGDPIPHRPFAVEQRLLAETHLSNIDPVKCRFVKRPKKWKDMKLLTCVDKSGRWNRIVLPWEELFRLDSLEKLGMRWISMDQFMDEVGADVRDHNWLEPFRRANQTVVFEDDEHVWAYRFAENGYKPPWQKKTSKNRSNKPPGPRQPVTLGKYRGPLLNLTQLRADLDAHGDFRILHFGSVFGSDRVVMSSKRGLELAKAVEDAMLYANPVLHRLADGVVGKLGGRGSFLGLHLRIGEARGGGEMFSSKPDETIAAAVAELDAWVEGARRNATANGKKPKKGQGTKNLGGLWKKVTEGSVEKRKKGKGKPGGMIAVGSVPAPRNRKPADEEGEAAAAAEKAPPKAPELDEARPPKFNNIGGALAPPAEHADADKVVEAAEPAKGEEDKAPEEAKEAAAADGAAPANATDAPAAGPASHPLSPYLPADPSTVSDPESLLEICKHLHATAKDPWSVPIVYVATDALDARNNPSFRALFDKYPCTFVLGDLMHQPSGLAKAKDVAFPDGRLVPAEVFTRRTAHLFVPLVDQIAVASGAHFVGTAKSTFSQYAARLHAHWIERGEHPMAPKRKGKRKD